jgi:hypothetical protein
VGRALAAAVLQTGLAYHRSVPERLVAEFRRALAARGLDPDGLLRAPVRTDGAVPPWRAVSTGVGPEVLERQYEKNRKFEEAAARGGGAGSGIPGEGPSKPPGVFEPRDSRTGAAESPGTEVFARNLAASVSALRASLREVFLDVSAPASHRGLDRSLLASAAASALMRAEPRLTPHFFGFVRSFWDGRENPPWVRGRDVLVTRWREEGLGLLRAALADRETLARANGELVGEGRIFGEAQGFPDAFRLRIASPFAFDPSGYYRRNGLSAVYRKIAEGRLRHEFTAASLKKKRVLSLEAAARPDGGAEVELAAGPRFGLVDFLKSAFAFGDRADWAAADVEAFLITD